MEAGPLLRANPLKGGGAESRGYRGDDEVAAMPAGPPASLSENLELG